MGGGSHEWLPRHTNEEELIALLEVLKECCQAHQGQLRRAQPAMDITNRSVGDAFTKGRDRKTQPSTDFG